MTWMLNRELEKLGFEVSDLTYENLMSERYDLVHLHFFEGQTGFKNPFRVINRMGRLLKAIDRQKKLGAKLIYTAHNVVTHDAPWRKLEDWYVQQFTKRVDGTIFVSEVSVPLVRAKFPELHGPSTIIPLSDYGDFYPNTVSRKEARAHFGITESALTLSHVGLIKPYKNVPALIRAFKGIPGDLALLIGGRCLEDVLRSEIQQLASEDPRVVVDIRHLEDEDMQLFLNASDVCIFPYRNILNSGSAMMALTFGKPVVVPNVGSMPELQRRVNADWVRLYDGEFGVEALSNAIQWTRETNRGAGPPLQELSVTAVAAKHAEFYRLVCKTA